MTNFWKVRYRFAACGGVTDIQVVAPDMAQAERMAIRRLREKFGAEQVSFVAAWKFDPPRRYYQRCLAGAVACHPVAVLGSLFSVPGSQGGTFWLLAGLAVVVFVIGGWGFIRVIRALESSTDQRVAHAIDHDYPPLEPEPLSEEVMMDRLREALMTSLAHKSPVFMPTMCQRWQLSGVQMQAFRRFASRREFEHLGHRYFAVFDRRGEGIWLGFRRVRAVPPEGGTTVHEYASLTPRSVLNELSREDFDAA